MRGDIEQLLTRTEVLEFFGGTRKPMDSSTLYRGMEEGRFPRPIKIGPKTARWRLSECQAAMDRLLEERALNAPDEPPDEALP